MSDCDGDGKARAKAWAAYDAAVERYYDAEDARDTLPRASSVARREAVAIEVINSRRAMRVARGAAILSGPRPGKEPKGLGCDCRGACGCHYAADALASEEACADDGGSGCSGRRGREGRAPAAPDMGRLINSAASASAAVVDARARLESTPRKNVAAHERARVALVGAMARKGEIAIALAEAEELGAHGGEGADVTTLPALATEMETAARAYHAAVEAYERRARALMASGSPDDSAEMTDPEGADAAGRAAAVFDVARQRAGYVRSTIVAALGLDAGRPWRNGYNNARDAEWDRLSEEEDR